MFLARVTGSVVATQKVASMTGRKLLTVEPLRGVLVVFVHRAAFGAQVVDKIAPYL